MLSIPQELWFIYLDTPSIISVLQINKQFSIYNNYINYITELVNKDTINDIVIHNIENDEFYNIVKI